MIAGAWKGVIRTMPIRNFKHVFDLIPIDISVNLIITAAWNTATDIA